MLRIKYHGFNGTQPQSKIIETVPSLTNQDLYMGRFPHKEGATLFCYGEVNCQPADHAAIVSACASWGMVELTDQEAKDFADAFIAGGTVISPKVTVGAAEIQGDKVVKPETLEF